MTNVGKFDCHVEWELKSQPPPVTPPAAGTKPGKQPAKSAKDAAAAAAAATPVFLFEPKVLSSILAAFMEVNASSFRCLTCG